jgi:hypothetical protein
LKNHLAATDPAVDVIDGPRNEKTKYPCHAETLTFRVNGSTYGITFSQDVTFEESAERLGCLVLGKLV